MSDIGVLIVEDEPIAANAHCTYLQRIPGFVVRGVAHDGTAAIRQLGDPASGIDLVLLDMHLPDLHGLDVVRAMRTAGHRADVIAVLDDHIPCASFYRCDRGRVAARPARMQTNRRLHTSPHAVAAGLP